MAPSKPRSRARQFDHLLKSQPKPDFDPEADDLVASDDDNGAEADGALDSADQDSADDDGGREHYVDVGKSRLRKAGEVALGPRYRGTRVSRNAMAGEGEDEDEDERFAGEDDEESSEEDLLEDIDGEDEEDDDLSQDDGLAGLNGEDDEQSEADSETEAQPQRPRAVVDAAKKTQLRDLMQEERSVATSLSVATQADADKGRAVKKQRAAFDALLGTRIKLQKSLVGVNTAVGLAGDDVEADFDEAVAAAESAAFKLWSSLNDFREQMTTTQLGQKRKRSTVTGSTSVEDLWALLRDQEDSCLPQRNAILRKWSAKAGQAAALPKESGLRAGHQTATIIDALQQHLADSDRLVKKAQTPRSCAPLQLSRRVTHDEGIYDDADFYGQLLKELLERKSTNADAAPANIDVDFKAVKTNRNVDTKASKGRKLRYTVHEKLQNFMAPEDRGLWGQRQVDELFGSLFGQRMALAEEESEDGDAAEGSLEEGASALPEAGFMMFRSGL